MAGAGIVNVMWPDQPGGLEFVGGALLGIAGAALVSIGVACWLQRNDDPKLAAGLSAREVTRVVTPTAAVGVVCGPVDLELVRAAGSDRHYLCARNLQTVRPCTTDLSHEPKLPIVNPDPGMSRRSSWVS